MKILIVEDSERLRRSLSAGLRKSGYTVDLAADGEEGLEFVRVYRYDVILLDLMMPRLGGLDLLARLRAAGDQSHVLILSAKDQVEDRIRGLELGADDYLVKPFSFEELKARIQALVRRRYGKKNPVIRLGPLQIDTAAKQVSYSEETLSLTPSEYGLLEHLVLRRGRVVTQDQLIDILYDSRKEVASNVIEVVVCGLRKKIHPPGGPKLLVTRRGHGYVIE